MVIASSQLEKSRNVTYTYVDSADIFYDALKFVDSPLISVDTETTGLDPTYPGTEMRLVQICGSAFGSAAIFDIWRLEEREKKALKEFLESLKRVKIFHNAKFDLKFLLLNLSCVIDDRIFDTLIASQLIACGDETIRQTLSKQVR